MEADESDNVSRTSSSFDEQSDSSAESDHDDAEADIDKMLMDLEGFQVELVRTDSQPAAEEELPENNEPLDEISFSMNAIEESGDIDLDALLEDLCLMEKDLKLGVNNHSLTTETAVARSPSPTKRLSSPVKVSSDVKMQLEMLGEEIENQKELTIEEQQAKFKEEKIRIAMEKLREARIKKLVIKVFNDEDPTSKTILVDQNWTAWDVCKKMMVKYDREPSTNWLLEERQPENQLDRVLEDHECIVDIVSQWPRDTSNQLVFTMRRDKYVLFKSPQNYLLSSDTAEGSARLAEQSKDTLISEFFKADAMRLPNLDGVLYLKEGKKSWKKHYFLLRASGIYYTPKGKTKNQRNMSCLVSFDQTYVYTTNDFKRNQKAPYEHCFVIKPSVVKDLDSRQVKCLCALDAQTMQRWVTCIRVGKFGYKMLENKNNVYEEVEDLTGGNLKRSRTMSSGSSSSSEIGPFGGVQQDNGTRVRARSDVADHTYKRTLSRKQQPEKEIRTIGRLFQDAWKKGGAADQKADSPTSPPTPFSPLTSSSPSRTGQTPTSGPKSFFVENEKLRNLDNIKEENDVPPSKTGLSLVLDPAPPPRSSFSNPSNENSSAKDNDTSAEVLLPSPPPAVLPKQMVPSPDLPPPPPPVLPKVVRTKSTTSDHNDTLIKDEMSRNDDIRSPRPPVTPKQTSLDGSLSNGLQTPDSYSNGRMSPIPPPPPPPPLYEPESEISNDDDLPLPPPPVLLKPDLHSPNGVKRGKPEIHFPPPPPLSADVNASAGKQQSIPAPPPPPPPPPPLPFETAEVSTKM